MQLVWFDVVDLTAQAGGDPWEINRSLQAGSLTTGPALQEPGDHGVSRALFYAPPASRRPHPNNSTCSPATSTPWRPPRGTRAQRLPALPDNGGTRTTNYNIAVVLAGLGDKAVTTK